MKPTNSTPIVHKPKSTLMQQLVKKLQLQGINAQLCKRMNLTTEFKDVIQLR
jgi:hypothetical protein